MVKILYIDHQQVIPSILRDELCRAGYDLSQAGTAAEALEIAIHNAPDLALVAIHASDEANLSLALRLNQEFNIYSIFLSGCDDQALVENAVNAGALGYLRPPLDKTSILPAIATALAIRKELTELAHTKEKLISSLDTSRIISTAIGIYMERFHVNQKQAFEKLRSYARRERRKLTLVAEELVRATENRNELIDKIHSIDMEGMRSKAKRSAGSKDDNHQ